MIAQTALERRRLAVAFGEQLLSRDPQAGLDPYRRFSDWLHRQPDEVRHEYLHDFSGDRLEIDEPAVGSCKWKANERMRSTIPASVPAVETQAGRLYERLVIRTKIYRKSEAAWRSCMRRRGYHHAGEPLDVWRPGLPRLLAAAQTLPRPRRKRLERSLSKQAIAEHQCAVEHLDDAVRRGDRRVVRALIAKFPEYRRLVTR